MSSERKPEDQAAMWNGEAGRTWVEAQDLLDAIFEPIQRLLAESIPPEADWRVLDIGCGSGSTTIALAQRLSSRGQCIGVDISEPMIAAAREKADRRGVSARFVRDDAQTHGFEPASVDLIVSRFGVMFFRDSVQAFTNLRKAAKDAAQLRFVVWRSADDNPFMTAAERIAAPLLPNLPPRDPHAPGQFAFADPHVVRGILEASAWGDVEIEALDVVCRFPQSELRGYIARLGPVGRALQALDVDEREHLIDAIGPAFDAYVHQGEVRFTAACWMVTAHAVR